MKMGRVIFGISTVVIIAVALVVLAEAKMEATAENLRPDEEITFT